MIPCDQQFIPEPDCQDPGPPSGGGINPHDTYVAANVVQTFTTAIIDDATGEVHTTASDPVPFVLEAGYSLATGADVVQHVYSNMVEDDALRVVRVDGSTAIELGADGYAAPAVMGDLDGEVLNPLSAMPDLSMFPSVIDAIAGGATGSFRVGAVAEQMTGVNVRAVQLRSGVSATMTDENHFELRMSESGATRPGAGEIEVSFDRRKRGDQWVLRRIDQLTDIAERGKRASMRSRLEFKGMRVARNVDADRRRDAKRAKRFASMQDATSTLNPKAESANLPGVSLSTTPPPDNWSSTGVINWSPPTALPYPAVPPTTPAPGLAPDFDKTDEEKTGCENAAFATQNAIPVSSGLKISFQHGFASGACTWKYLIPSFASYGAGGRVIGNTDALALYEQQASTLRDQMGGAPGWVMVGHSNGGIISRYLAQTQPSGFAKAVITINSPHQGARVVNKVAGVINDLQWLNIAAGVIYSRRSAGAINMAALMSPNSILRKIFYGGIVIQQMAEGSAFLTELGNRPETGFRKYAIRSQVHSEWQSVRVICDVRTPTSAGVPAGRRCVEDTKRYVKRTSFTAGVLSLLAIVSSVVPGLNLFTSTLTYHAKTHATIMGLMYTMDWVWREAFSGYAASDGVVPMSSQRWQAAASERVINGADSHVGSTKSALVRIQLASLLQESIQ